MRAKVDLLALQRELTQRIKTLQRDTVFLSSIEGSRRVDGLGERLEKVEFILENFELIDWLFNPQSSTKRADLVNQDKIV